MVESCEMPILDAFSIDKSAYIWLENEELLVLQVILKFFKNCIDSDSEAQAIDKIQCKMNIIDISLC